MAGVEVMIKELACLRCGHRWLPNSENAPRVCPLCHSPYWNKLRTLRNGTRSAGTGLGRRARRLANKAVPKSMFGASPDLPSFIRQEDDIRV